MSVFTDITIFAVVLAVNLLLIGAILAGGIALVFRFTESVAPGVRYLAAVAVFLTTIIFSFVAAMERRDDAIQRKETVQISNGSERKNDSVNFATQEDFANRQPINFDPAIADRNLSRNLLSDFIFRFGDSLFAKIFLSVWILGVVLLFVREIIGWRRLKKARKFWVLATEAERESLQCAETARLYFADNQTPGTAGFFRPAIVLPKEFPAGISLEAKQFIVRHELAHARAFDPFGGFLVRAVRNLLWISPALWLLEKLIDAEREAAADRAAIGNLPHSKTSEKFALDYAETLLLIAKAFNKNKQKDWQPQLIGINSGSELEIRIHRLLAAERLSFRQTAAALSACVLTAALMAVIPLAAFSEFNRKNYLNSVSAENSRKIFSDENETSAALFHNENDDSAEVELKGKNKNPNQSKLRLKKSAIENPVSSEQNSKDKIAQIENQNLKSFGEDDGVATSAKKMFEQDAVEAGLRENQRAAERLSDLESLSASRSLNDELNALQKLRPASKSKIILPNEDELSQQKAAGELDRRRSYQVNYPKTATAVPKRETYETKYVP